MDEDLDYNFQEGSSVIGKDKSSDPDVGNVSVLKQISKELAELKADYKSISKLDLNDKNFSIEQQLANNKWALNWIDSIKLKIDEKLKELSNGR